jgi:protein SERAC1
LVCANALSRQDVTTSAYEHIVDRTRGLIFLGTPFGESKSNHAKIALHFFELQCSINSQIPKHLEKRSQKLASIIEAFLGFLRARDRSPAPIEIACFFEEREITVAGKNIIIVPRDSATLPGFDSYSISANHVEMSKFKDEGDAGYILISMILSQWIRAFDVSMTAKSDIRGASHVYSGVHMGNVYSGNVYGGDSFFGGKNANIWDSLGYSRK